MKKLIFLALMTCTTMAFAASTTDLNINNMKISPLAYNGSSVQSVHTHWCHRHCWRGRHGVLHCERHCN